jgi:YCII-related domain/Sigma-70 region 2
VKYVLLFCGTDEDAAAFAALSEADLKERHALVGRGAGAPVVTDGPFLEGKEQIGGYAEIEVADLTAYLVRVLGDFAVAEEIVQDSLLAAWERWRAGGIPDNPPGWLWTVARRCGRCAACRLARS